MAQRPSFRVLFSEEELRMPPAPSTASLPSHSSKPSQPLSTPSTQMEEWTMVPSKSSSQKKLPQISQPSITKPKDSSDDEVNAHLTEKIAKLPVHRRPDFAPNDHTRVVNKLHSTYIAKYVDWLLNKHKTETGTWLDSPEIPTAKEIMDENEPWMQIRNENGVETIFMQGNKLYEPWPNVATYLSGHYEMLREEAVQPLRQAIYWVKTNPSSEEHMYESNSIGIYSKVHITLLTFSPRGLGVRVVFSLSKVGKKIRWEQSKRLMSSSMVVLSPTDDMFKTKCIVATVAARPLDLLNQPNMPPMIDLFFADAKTLDLDPSIEYTMVEERSTFLEPIRHVGLGLQRLATEEFPLKQQLVKCKTPVPPPDYIKQQPVLDLSTIFKSADANEYNKIDVLHEWPKAPPTTLDMSQLNALHSIFRQRVAMIQGPPGTGKTHVSVLALMALLQNMSPEDPPIVVACQTNHALDQLLRHVAEFEDKFVRLGARSRDTGVVREHTLYNLRQKKGNRYTAPGGMRASARHGLANLEDKMREILAPLEFGKENAEASFLSLKLYRKMGILTNKQCDRLEMGENDWTGSSGNDTEPLAKWLGKCLQHNQRRFEPDQLGDFEFEEDDLEFEQLKELEAENACQDDFDNDSESLPGNGFPIFLATTGKPSTIGEADIGRWLKKDDLWQTPAKHRGAVFNHILRKAVVTMNERVHDMVVKFNEASLKWRYSGFENNSILVRQQKLIGVTTTGLSKYRALIAAANPRVLMIEEAAETMEAPVAAGCMPSLEHLILVGDHKQLRPGCGVKYLEHKPYYLNVSMFERLINNKMPFKMLKRQRRMIPEVRRLLGPIYKNDINDHPSMRDPAVRPPVPGMGGVNSFLYSHSWPEAVDDNKSCTNVQEADMVVGMYDYLISNGLTENEITILTFYNGQRKLLLRKLRNHPRLKRMGTQQNRIFKVLTVDSYQGEENEIILLSLVRSNGEGILGFIKYENRVCVALSRAKRGFYMFGNAELLACESKLWAKIINIMLADSSIIEEDRNPATEPFGRLVFRVPLRCSNHNNKVYIERIHDWDDIDGGCELPCGGTLSCGHRCTLRCHPFSHEKALCLRDCDKILACGHKCSKQCYDKCHCMECAAKTSSLLLNGNGVVGDDSDDNAKNSNAKHWQQFADGGVHKHDAALVEMQRERYLQQQMKVLSTGAAKHVVTEAKAPSAVQPAVILAAAAQKTHSPLGALAPAPVPMLVETPSTLPALTTPPRNKISHQNRFKRAPPSSTPVATRPARALATTPAPTSSVPISYMGVPSLQAPLVPLRQTQNQPLVARFAAPSISVVAKTDNSMKPEVEEDLIDLS